MFWNLLYLNLSRDFRPNGLRDLIERKAFAEAQRRWTKPPSRSCDRIDPWATASAVVIVLVCIALVVWMAIWGADGVAW